MDNHHKCYFSSPTWAFFSVPGSWSITLAAHCTTSSISQKNRQRYKESRNSWSCSTRTSNLSDNSKGADNSADWESLYTEVLFAFASLLECRVHGGTLRYPNKQVCVCVCVWVCALQCPCQNLSCSLYLSSSPPCAYKHTHTHTYQHIGIQMRWAHSFQQLLAVLTAAVCCSRGYDSFTGGRPS